MQLEFSVTKSPDSVKRPADGFHWLQFISHYFEDENGNEVVTNRFIKNRQVAKDWCFFCLSPIKKGQFKIDTIEQTAVFDQVATYPAKAPVRRTAKEVSIFDARLRRAERQEHHKRSHFYDTYLIYDSGKNDGRVLYHIEWQEIQRLQNGAFNGASTYEVTLGDKTNKLPPYAQGNSLYWAYAGRNAKGAFESVLLVRNPIPIQNR